MGSAQRLRVAGSGGGGCGVGGLEVGGQVPYLDFQVPYFDFESDQAVPVLAYLPAQVGDGSPHHGEHGNQQGSEDPNRACYHRSIHGVTILARPVAGNRF